MNSRLVALIDRLASYHSLTLDEYQLLIDERTSEIAEYAATLAVKARRKSTATPSLFAA